MMIYKMTTCIATLSLQQQLSLTTQDDGACSSGKTTVDQATMLKAVERSRMVVSTVDTFLHTKIDRVVKSVREYVKGKAVKAVLMNHWNELEPK
jgi:Ni2+-binding GTPase involved in maturation of urease and hydrogenase